MKQRLQVAPKGKVYAIDEDEAAIKLTTSNVEKFGVKNNVSSYSRQSTRSIAHHSKWLMLFMIGGGGVSLRAILQIANSKLRSNGRIVINAILLETATTAIAELKAAGLQRYRYRTYFGCEGKTNKQRNYDDGKKSNNYCLSDKTLGENYLAGTFIGIGVGPGDPELITIKAVKALKAVDVICVPKSHAHKQSMALKNG